MPTITLVHEGDLVINLPSSATMPMTLRIPDMATFSTSMSVVKRGASRAPVSSSIHCFNCAESLSSDMDKCPTCGSKSPIAL